MNRVSSIIHLDYARQHGLTGQGIGVAILIQALIFIRIFILKKADIVLPVFWIWSIIKHTITMTMDMEHTLPAF